MEQSETQQYAKTFWLYAAWLDLSTLVAPVSGVGQINKGCKVLFI